MKKNVVTYLAGVIRHISNLLYELVGRSVVTSVTGSRHIGSAVQNELNGQIDIIALPVAGDLDAIRKTTQGAMRPAGSAVLRKVLVERVGQEADSIDISP